MVTWTNTLCAMEGQSQVLLDPRFRFYLKIEKTLLVNRIENVNDFFPF